MTTTAKLLLFTLLTCGCGAGSFFRSAKKTMDDARATSAASRELIVQTRRQMSWVVPLSVLGAAGALFTVGKSARRYWKKRRG